jgi:hypothetical protein
MDGLTTNLLQTSEKVLCNIDWLLQRCSSDICSLRSHGEVIVWAKVTDKQGKARQGKGNSDSRKLD